ncbi:MAG: DNA polymerase III subunit beta [Cyanobacteriota bacterium]
MQFVVQKENLLNALNAVSKATTSRGIQPILANILIDAIDSKSLKLVATDLDISVEAIIPATVTEEGQITLQAKKLIEIATNLSGESVSFDINTEKMIAKINSAQAKFEIMGISADEFPKITRIQEKEEFKIELELYLKSIRQTKFAAASFESNNVLSGVYLSIKNDEIEVAATDGNRLARKQTKLPNTLEKEFSVVVPTRILDELLRISSSGSYEELYIGISEGQISFRLTDRYLLSRLLEGRYPDYPKLIPANYETIVRANREDLVSSIRRTSVMANERTNIVKLDFEKHKLNLSANTPDMGDASDVMEVDFKEGGLKIAFNYKFLVEALQVIESHDVRMEFGGSLAPALLKTDEDEGYLCLIMPVQVK